ncbi:hypothetical protein DL546_002839 [Coniochaeta pulveracea]|uniref:ORC6 first cyclin-like domain-containing protein n=1 Tax=Coniochaeta pulveracea TaxID=177199 RepID=A0A420XZ03_9PEZI|nr:hypothetical protein DL546_002839 [Coniochaeta pulveracea]
MNKSIEQALISLIPTHPSPLPQPLVDLASSLLAQSNHKASTLKQDEEIARPYACAHLACDRLKISLNLPPIDPRPPVPPRIYKRLYNHLDNILPNSQNTPGRSSRNRTPSAKLREQQDTFRSSLSRPSPLNKTTPGKVRSLADFRGSQPGTPSRSGRTSAHKAELPPWIRPTLRYLCAQLSTPAIAPTVIAGIDSILVPHGRRTSDEWVWSHLTSLLAALYLYVWNSVSHPNGVDEERYVAARSSVIDTLAKTRGSITVSEVDAEVAWEGWEEVTAEDVDNAALVINRHGWLESDWAKGIQGLIRQDAEEDDLARGGTLRGNRNSEAGSARRGDVMFQEKYDYLSERKRNAYAAWEEGILERIRVLESTGAMDVDS